MSEVAEGFPKLEKNTRPWQCRKDDAACTRKVPCASCRGARNRRSGMRKQREARKALEALTGADAARFIGQLGNEEAWSGLPLRVEVKSGVKAKVVWTQFVNARDQSDATKAIGDTRPFGFIAVAPRAEPLLVVPISQFLQVIEAVLNA